MNVHVTIRPTRKDYPESGHWDVRTEIEGKGEVGRVDAENVETARVGTIVEEQLQIVAQEALRRWKHE